MLKFKVKGDFKKLNGYFEKLKEIVKLGDLDKYGELGVAALKANTPKDSGLTADSWYYTIDRNQNGVSLVFNNSNINDGVSVAIILQYGHGTGTGGWVEGIDYINPSLKPLFEDIANKAWKEVRELV